MNELLTIIFIFLLFLGGYSAGYFLGRRNTSENVDGDFTRVSNIQAGLMGLLGVMLAFSFSLASQRFEQRRQLTIQESSIIGTAYFRAGLLPDSLKKDIRQLIKNFINIRTHYYQKGNSRYDMEEIQTMSENIQVSIWAKTAELGKEHYNLNTNLNVLALNEMIETTGNISSSFQSRVPVYIHILLTFIMLSTVLTIGYNDGLSKDRKILFMLLLNLVLCTILLLIIDLDTPTTGFLKTNIYSLQKLNEAIYRYDK